MVEQAKRVSILDGLKAGEVILASGGESVDESNALADETGGGALEPSDAFGPDPDPGAGLELAGNDNGDGPENEPGNGPERPASQSRPGAPRGRASPNYGKKTAAKENIGFIEQLLVGVHTIGASIVKDPTWELSEDEAKKLAEGLANVQAQYDMVLDPKTEAWIKLMGIAGSIYGPRIVIPMMARRAMREEPPPEVRNDKPKQSGGVVNLRPQPQEKGAGPGGAFTPSQMMPPGWGSGAEEVVL